jgi:hypothetical protein
VDVANIEDSEFQIESRIGCLSGHKHGSFDFTIISRLRKAQLILFFEKLKNQKHNLIDTPDPNRVVQFA